MAYFYAEVGGGQTGPVAIDAFASLLAAGYATLDTLVWTTGMPSWTALRAMASDPAFAMIVAPPAVDEARPPASKRPREVAADGDEGYDDDEADAEDDGEEVAHEGAFAGPPAVHKRSKRKKGTHKARRGPQTSAYVTGLPPDVTMEEMAAHFKVAGMVMVDAETAGPKVRIYRAEAGGGGPCKGDGAVCFVQPASVELAITLLDGVALRAPVGRNAGWPLHVEAADFERPVGATKPARAAAAPALEAGKASKALTAAQRAARIRTMEQAVRLSWADEGDEAAPVSTALASRVGGVGADMDLRIVVLKHMYDPAEVSSHPEGRDGFVADLEEDVGQELAVSCGDVEKMTAFLRHEDGVLIVKFKTAGAAARCLSGLHGRFYAGRKVEVSLWDGVTDYSHRESAEEEAGRVADFGSWLEGGGEGAEDS
jgi:HIV Tat-specific factor 1